jgi:hypothetical protein
MKFHGIPDGWQILMMHDKGHYHAVSRKLDQTSRK